MWCTERASLSPTPSLLRVVIKIPLLAVIDLAAIAGRIQWLIKDRSYSYGESVGVNDGA